MEWEIYIGNHQDGVPYEKSLFSNRFGITIKRRSKSRPSIEAFTFPLNLIVLGSSHKKWLSLFVLPICDSLIFFYLVFIC